MQFDTINLIVTRGGMFTETVALSATELPRGASAWSAFTVTAIVLAALAVAAPITALRKPTVANALGAAALALAVFRLVEFPGTDEVWTLAPGAALALAGAVALCASWLRIVAPLVLLAALWMPWYGVHAEVSDVVLSRPWTVFTLTDVALLACALGALWRRWFALPAVVLVGVNVVFPPEGLEPRTGAFIALAAALLAALAPRAA